MEFLYCSLIGYAVGVLNPAYFLGKIQGFDIRQKGSGNAGASNALIVMGKMIGALCALLDIVKTCVAIWLTRHLFPDFRYAFAVTSTACVLGHIFPFYMRFKGGKGLACLGGIVLMYDLRVFFVLLAMEIVVAFVTDYICFVPITASLIFPTVYGIMQRDLTGATVILIAGVAIFGKHLENLRRIRNGTEAHLSFIWNKEAELTRLQENIGIDGSEGQAIPEHLPQKKER
ncbi:MAG: glycerol-3-phosphate acyltransferase [Eubacteriales bacterium]